MALRFSCNRERERERGGGRERRERESGRERERDCVCMSFACTVSVFSLDQWTEPLAHQSTSV